MVPPAGRGPYRARRVLAAFGVLLAIARPAAALEGRVVDARSGAPIAGAEVTIVGLTGAVKTDADGRFSWKPDPAPPFVVLVILPGGRFTKPVYFGSVDWAAVLTVPVEAVVNESVTVVGGVAPSIDAAPGAGMTLLLGREVALRAPANLTQALENVPGVSQVSEGHAAVPAVRGLARGRTLILIDGARVTSERRVGPSATFLDPGALDGIEVARGPGSVAYGSDAFGGVIAVRTRRPDHQAPLQVRVSGTMGAGIPERRGDVEISRGFGTGGFVVQTRFRQSEDYRGPGGPVLNSGWKDHGVLFRVERKVRGGLVSAGWQSDFGRDIERPRSNSASVRFYTPHETSHRFTVSWEQRAGGYSLKASGLVGGYEQRTDQDRVPTGTVTRRIERADISARDFQVRLTADRAFGDTKLEFGADVNGRFGLEARDIIVTFDPAGDVASETGNVSIASARRTDTGVFTQLSTAISPVVTAAGGVRVDGVRTVNRGGFFGDRAVSHTAAAGFGALTLGPFDGVTVTAQASRGFRDPTLSDRFFRGPTGRGFVTGNPDLEPETSRQFDVGVRYATGRVRLAAYAYHYRITNLIERFTTAPDFFLFRNRGRATLRGLELEAQLSLGRGYSAELAAQFARGRSAGDGAALDDVAAPSVSVLVRKSVGERAGLHLRVAGTAPDDRPGPSEVRMPGFTSVDAGAVWRASARFELRASARNLLNRTWYASPDPRWVVAAGRNVSVSAVVKF